MMFGRFLIARSRSAHAVHRGLAKVLASAAALATALALAGVGSHRARASTQTSALQIGASIDVRCSIIANPLSFGSYSPLSATHHDVTGSLSLNCESSRFITRIRIDQGLTPAPGSNNSNPLRQMSDGAGGLLQYNVYRDAARTEVWGNTNPTGVNPGDGPYPMTIPVYGRIPAAQSPQPGSYTDTLAVTILF